MGQPKPARGRVLCSSPLVVESLGGWHKVAERAVKKLAGAKARPGGAGGRGGCEAHLHTAIHSADAEQRCYPI